MTCETQNLSIAKCRKEILENNLTKFIIFSTQVRILNNNR